MPHFVHPMALLLLAAGVLALFSLQPGLAVIIWGMVLVNAGFSFWQSYRAGQATQVLQELLPAYARAIRSGVESQFPAVEIVPGDLLILAEGDRIPADARIIEEYGLRVNNSTLTGEALPSRKTADASFREDISELEQPNLAFAGTTIVSGTAKAVVFATGMSTQFGRIAHLTQTADEMPGALQQEIFRLTRKLSWIVLGLASIVFLVALFQLELKRLEAFLLALGIMVAVLPEGLPATVSLTLAIASQRLAKRGVLVKSPSVIETLGNISVICTDKSGTLTQNQMTVRWLWVPHHHVQISGIGYEPVGEFTPSAPGQPFEKDLAALLHAAILCNNARLTPPSREKPQWSCLGDQTEAALKAAAIKGGVIEAPLAVLFPRLHEIPFDARRKRMCTIHTIKPHLMNEYFPEVQENPRIAVKSTPEIALVKGAPREVIQLCTHVLVEGVPQPFNESLRKDALAANDHFAQGALRVLALAYRILPPKTRPYSSENIEQGLTLLGLAAMMDPPRPEIAEAIQTCQQAGIRFAMITGDYGLTAASLARRVGMLTTDQPRIITGAEIEELTAPELRSLLSEEVIFARMAPDHKLRLVAAFQESGEIVAVTGDGVNDAPALRKADVGIAMGITGTDVAKEAADIILTNDNFASIVAAIEEGAPSMIIYANLSATYFPAMYLKLHPS